MKLRAFLVALLLAASTLFVGGASARAGYEIKVASCSSSVAWSGSRYGTKAQCTQQQPGSGWRAVRAVVACHNENTDTGWIWGTQWATYVSYPPGGAIAYVWCPSSTMTVYATTFQLSQ